MRQSTPCALAALGLTVGLAVLLSGSFPTPEANHFVGGVFLTIAVASVTHLTVEFSGPDERYPDF